MYIQFKTTFMRTQVFAYKLLPEITRYTKKTNNKQQDITLISNKIKINQLMKLKFPKILRKNVTKYYSLLKTYRSSAVDSLVYL